MTTLDTTNTQAQRILKKLAKHAILVGSAARNVINPGDLDLLLSDRGIEIARSVLPKPWISVDIGHIKTFEMEPHIEVFVNWYGPNYRELVRKHKAELKSVTVYGVEFRAWPLEPWRENEYNIF